MSAAIGSETFKVTIPSTFNIASYFIDRNVEQGRGGNIAVYEDGRKLTYAQLAEMVNRAGNAFRSLGLERENRVVLALPDSAEFVAAFFGAAKIGAVPIPINPGVAPQDVVYFLNDSGAKVLVIQDDAWGPVQAHLNQAATLKEVLIAPAVPAQQKTVSAPQSSGARYGVHVFNDAMEAASPNLDPEATSKDDMAFFLYTSGSTGGPKGAVHLQHDMLVATECFARHILKIAEKDICFSASKLFFAYGLGNGSYFPFSVGAAAVYNPHRPKTDVILDYIEKFRPTLFFGVPTLYTAMLQAPEKRDLASIRMAVSAGEALPPDIFQRFKERFGVELLDSIGSTEMLHIFICNRHGDIRLGSTGKIVPGYDAKVVDDSWQPVPAGEIGNLWVKGDSAAAFYWRRSEKSRQTMLGEWMVTGDKYYIDKDGYFFYCGRADDMLRCSGQWVSPVEVENAIIAHPAVLEVAVVGKGDADGLIKPKAYIVLKSGCSAPKDEELKDFLKGKLPGYKSPRWFEFVPDLPKTATGKIQRFALRSR
jgi:benzoate-CoA ligase